MRAVRLIPVILALSLLAAPAGAEESALVRVEKVMEAPLATGLVVTGVRAGSPAATAGIRPGDILVSYAGTPTPTHDALAAAKRVAIQSRGPSIEVEVMHPDGISENLPLSTGRIGIEVLPVEKGVPATMLPPATRVDFAVQRLQRVPQDEWFGFRFPPGPKIGFEHSSLRVEGERIQLVREVAFDGGRQWGLNHFLVTVTADVSDPLRIRKMTFAAPLESFESTGTPAVERDGTPLWVTEYQGRVEETGETITGRDQVTLPRDLPVIPSYFVEALASLMQKEEGTCLHFRPLSEGDGRPMLKSALLVTVQEEVELGDAKVRAWRIEQRRAGGQVVGVYWIDDQGRTVRSAYGGPEAVRTSKQIALSGLHPDLEVRSAN